MLKNKTKLVFFSSDIIAITCLEALLHDYSVLVVTKSDKQQKRSQHKKANTFAQYCETNKIQVLKIDKFDEHTIQAIKNHRTNIAVCFSFGMIIPVAVLNLYPNRLINIHPSALPKYRGPSPIQAALLNNEQTTAISFMIMNSNMDEGDILKQININIDPNDTYTSLSNKIAKLSGQYITNILQAYTDNKINPIKQIETEATYCKMINKKNAEINFTNTAQSIYNKYRAYFEWPKIYTHWNNKKLILTDIEIYPNSANKLDAGTVYKHGSDILVQTAAGSIKLNQVQIEGKKNMPIHNFVNGHSNFVNSQLATHNI